MVAAFLISFREGLEAALIIGIILGYLRKTEAAQQKRRFVWVGVLLAVLLSIASAAGLQFIGFAFEGRAEEIFEGVTMLLAAGVLTWVIFWMRRQSPFMKTSLERHLQSATRSGAHWGLLGVAFLSVFREGIETALFLSAAAFASDGISTLLGAILGLVLAISAGYVIYASASRLNLRKFFNVTSLLLLLFAAGLVAHGVHELQEAGLLITLREHIWDINRILDESSPLGELLKTLIGYNGNPSLLEVIAYWGYWILVLVGLQAWSVKNSSSQAPIKNI